MIFDRQGYLTTIRFRLRDNPVVALPGPRQAGKTTLARMLAETSPELEIHHFDLESPADLARLSNPELVLSRLRGLIILDEIQRMPGLYPVLRVLADRPDHPARFLIPGSASPALVGGASETLAGRISFIDVSGFSLPEVGTEHLGKRWWRGGFPRAYLARDDKTARQWHENFFRTFLEQDIPQLGIRIPATTLRRFWTMVAHYHGQVLLVSELARSLGTSEPTARRYLDILCGTYVVRQLPTWFENLKKRQVKAPKVYIRNSGILHALLSVPDAVALESHPKLGASWEGFAMEQILSLTGDREAGHSWRCGAGLARLPQGQAPRLRIQIQRKPRHLQIDAHHRIRPEFGPSLRGASRKAQFPAHRNHHGEHFGKCPQRSITPLNHAFRRTQQRRALHHPET